MWNGSMGFGDFDEGTQRAIWSAVTLVCLLLAICLLKWVHYAFLAITFVFSMYGAYVLFLKPRIAKKGGKTKDEK